MLFIWLRRYLFVMLNKYTKKEENHIIISRYFAEERLCNEDTKS